MDTFGFNTWFSRISKHRKIIYTIYFAHTLLAFVFSIYKFKLIFTYYIRIGPVQAIVEFLQYSLSLLTYWMIIFDSIFQREAHTWFWWTLSKIDDCFCHQMNHKFRLFMFKFVEIFSIKILIYVIRIKNDNIDEFSFMYAALFVLCQIRVFYYLFCLEVVNNQLKIIYAELESLKVAFNPKFKDNRLKWIRGYFNYVYEMISCLNGIFGWSQIGTFASSFYLVLSQSTWDYIYYRDSSLPIRMGEFWFA